MIDTPLLVAPLPVLVAVLPVCG
uniref:Uncharacterized protein n=1 Tax=Rhizophora mucronata TaxID=61149 RepID=A0A2P2JGQ8_RHIMU